MMKLPIVAIGNSRGIRIPQAILKQCNINDEVSVEIDGRNIILKPIIKKEYDMTFESITEMDDPKIREMLRKTDPSTLAFALIGADEKTKNKIYKNMSKRAHEIFSKDVARYSAMDAKQLIVELHRARINQTFADLEQ
jgi:antitoxin MazE